jgi:hypothetical protein
MRSGSYRFGDGASASKASAKALVITVAMLESFVLNPGGFFQRQLFWGIHWIRGDEMERQRALFGSLALLTIAVSVVSAYQYVQVGTLSSEVDTLNQERSSLRLGENGTIAIQSISAFY